MNFRQHFETWHNKQYGYVGQSTGTAMSITYQTTACQQRWEAWQACADWHTSQEVAKQMAEAEKRRLASIPRCACCGTTENLHADLGSGGLYRCNSSDCVVF